MVLHYTVKHYNFSQIVQKMIECNFYVLDVERMNTIATQSVALQTYIWIFRQDWVWPMHDLKFDPWPNSVKKLAKNRPQSMVC